MNFDEPMGMKTKKSPHPDFLRAADFAQRSHLPTPKKPNRPKQNTLTDNHLTAIDKKLARLLGWHESRKTTRQRTNEIASTRKISGKELT